MPMIDESDAMTDLTPLSSLAARSLYMDEVHAELLARLRARGEAQGLSGQRLDGIEGVIIRADVPQGADEKDGDPSPLPAIMWTPFSKITALYFCIDEQHGPELCLVSEQTNFLGVCHVMKDPRKCASMVDQMVSSFAKVDVIDQLLDQLRSLTHPDSDRDI